MIFSCLGPSGVVAIVDYSLQIKIVKGRHRGIGLWVKVKKIRIPIKYLPRTRPPRPIFADPDLFSDLKISPEEWHQSLSTISSRSPEKVPRINCNLFIPSSKIFSFSDKIPFHVQLSGPLNSLRDLSQNEKSGPSPPVVRVHLLRQTSLEIDGQKAWRNSTLATGEIRPIPPPMSTITDPTGSREESFDWEGEVEVPTNISCPSFNVGDLAVKDFLVLTVIPSDPRQSALTHHQTYVSIKLVTDSWTEEPSS